MTTQRAKSGDKNWKTIQAKAPESYHTFVDNLVDQGKFESKAHVIRHALDRLKERIESDSPTGRLNALGLIDILDPANDRDLSQIVDGSAELTLVFNDMRLWLPGPNDQGHHLAALRRRLEGGKRTRIFLIHPKTRLMTEVASVSTKSEKIQADEIERAVTRICDGMWDRALPKSTIFEQRALQIIGHPRYNTYSMIMTDKLAYVNYYPIAFRGKEDVGHFHVYQPSSNRRGVYERLTTDLQWMKRAAEDEYHEGMDLVAHYAKKVRSR
jgi:Arc/MetJ-type ribon-helix-helix transcriptional regulator